MSHVDGWQNGTFCETLGKLFFLVRGLLKIPTSLKLAAEEKQMKTQQSVAHKC